MIKSYMDQMEERMINQMERTMSTITKALNERLSHIEERVDV